MPDSRLPPRRPPPPGARFRCGVCARFVQAGASGLCPRCGYAPSMPILRADQGAPGRDRRSGLWWALAALSLTVSILAAIAAVR
jgi:hypothetical protein